MSATSRAHRRIVRVETESFEPAGAQLIEQRAAGALELEVPRLERRLPAARRARWQRGARRRGASAGATISRGRNTESSSFSACHRSAPTYSAAVNSPVDRSSSATPVRSAPGAIGQQKRRLAGLEVAGVEQRARREHPDDLALHEPLRPARVLYLLADRDAVALADEPRQVCIEGVIGEATHRDRSA